MKPKVGMYLLIKPDKESWHYVKVAKITSVNETCMAAIAIIFTGDGNCPPIFKSSKHFVVDNKDGSYFILKDYAEVLAKVM